MTDCPAHIGQWHGRYYTAWEVFDALFSTDIDRTVFSSTTSVIELPPAELYNKVTREVQEAAADTPKCAGFKLHPYCNKWDCCFATPKVATQARDFEHDARQRELLQELFAYANAHKMMVLIHTGLCEDARPSRFEGFFDSALDAWRLRQEGRSERLQKKAENVYEVLTRFDIKHITILDGITEIRNQELAQCHCLESIDIPSSVTAIGSFGLARSLPCPALCAKSNRKRFICAATPARKKAFCHVCSVFWAMF